MRVGVLLLSAVELLQALGGLLEATQETRHPGIAGTHVEPLCVEPFVHQAVDRDRVVSAGDSILLLPRISASAFLRFQR